MPSRRIQAAKSFIALAITIGAFLSVFYVLKYLVGLEEEASGGIASLSFALFVNIDQALKTGQLRVLRPTWPRDIVPLDRYALPWPLMILYGVLSTLATLAFFPLSVLLFGYTTDAEGQFPVAVVLILIAMVGVTGAILYEIGFWVGTRCNRLSPLVVLCIVVLSGQIEMMLITPMAGLFESEQISLHPAALAYRGAVVGLLSLLPMMVGLWQGHRKRMASYLSYLLSRLSEDDQQAVLSLVYESTKEIPPGKVN
jgi:hypothetical protein